MRDPCESGNAKSRRESRSSSETGESDERKGPVKMRELKYLMGLEAKTPKLLEDKEVPDQSGDQDMSEVTDEPVTSSIQGSVPVEPEKVPTQLDLNAEPSTAPSPVGHSTHHEASSSVRKHKKPCEDNDSASSIGLDLDLNAEDGPSQNPFHPYKKLCNQAKSKDFSECASSTTGPLEEKEKDPLKIWKEMKQNGFLSNSHGGIPVPKHRGRKSKNELSKRRLELARKEQADKFAKLAAPSGLLNGLNPGIINHVRNRRQVHSIIEALVKSENPLSGQIGGRQGTHLRSGSKELGNRKESGTFSDFGANWQKIWNPVSANRPSMREGLSIGPEMVGRMFSRGLGPQYNPFHQNDSVASKLSASMGRAPEMSMSDEGLTNSSSVTSLSVKAATIASQWLELLHQDIKGRLSALKRSKRRVQAVIITELPFLIAKEFSDQENNPFAVKNCADGTAPSPTDAHKLRWTALFDQMDKALLEEEAQLEIWLNQVKEMQMHCDHGLQSVGQCNTAYGINNPGTTENMSRQGKSDGSDRELAVRAAAASIYSTCNFLLSKGDVSCF